MSPCVPAYPSSAQTKQVELTVAMKPLSRLDMPNIDRMASPMNSAPSMMDSIWREVGWWGLAHTARKL